MENKLNWKITFRYHRNSGGAKVGETFTLDTEATYDEIEETINHVNESAVTSPNKDIVNVHITRAFADERNFIYADTSAISEMFPALLTEAV